MSNRREQGIVYKATNNINGKVYIGQTWHYLSNRKSQHLRSTGCAYFHNALLKHGKENFTWDVLFESANQTDLDKEEIRLIKFYRSNEKSCGYNLREGGSCGEFSTVSRNKMKDSALRYFMSDIARKKQGNIQRKRYSYFEERVKHSRAHGGRPFFGRSRNSQRIFQTQSEAATFIGSTQGSIRSALIGKTKIVQGWVFSYTPIDKFVCKKPRPFIAIKDSARVMFDNLHAAAHMLGASFQNIYHVLHKKRKRAGGWSFYYADEYKGNI